MASRATKGVGGIVVWEMEKATAVGTRPAPRCVLAGLLPGLAGAPREALQPQVPMLHVPAQGLVPGCAGAETCVIEEPVPRLKVLACIAYDTLVFQRFKGLIALAQTA